MLFGTVTSRLSCGSPNLQNIPTKEKIIKNFFIPTDPNGFFVQLDLSQMELRILAIVSQEPFLLKAYKEGRDVHSEVAALLLNKKLEDVTEEERYKAKTLNFGIIYGMSPKKLAAETGMTKEEATNFIDDYYKKLPNIKRWKNATITYAQDHRYVKTLFGFKRRLYNILHSIDAERASAERKATNMPIQGTAGMYTLYCLCLIHDLFKEKNLKSKIVVTVHDSLGIDTFDKELEKVISIAQEKLEDKHFKWQTVPIKADVEVGPNWGEQIKLKDA